MADENSTQVLDYLREQFSRLHSRLDGHDRKFEEVILRLGRVEREVVNLHGDFANQSIRLDNLSDRLDRIERRLDLVEG